MTPLNSLTSHDFLSAKRVLCIQPHYDDNDIGAAGTLALLVQAGAEIDYLTVTDDLMGLVDHSLSPEAGADALKHDQFMAGEIIGVRKQCWLGYPDAGEYSYHSLRKDILRSIRQFSPDFIFTCDPWLTYEAHRDHIQVGLAVAEATILANITKITSGDPALDAAYRGGIQGIAFYMTREPNLTIDITSTWEKKVAAVHSYMAQFDNASMAEMIHALDAKSLQLAVGHSYWRGEALKVLHPSALHCGI